MTLSIAQSAHPDSKREGYWKWSVWINGSDAELAEIEEVNYVLHPTFPRRFRRATRRDRKFRLNGSGWGEFNIYAKVQKLNGEEIDLKHWLTLREDPSSQGSLPTSQQTERPERPRRVFLSYAASDSSVAEAIQRTLQNRGVAVVSANSIPLGESLSSSVEHSIGASDGTIVVVPSHTSPSIDYEVRVAEKYEVPVFPIVVGTKEIADTIAFRPTKVARAVEKPDIDRFANSVAAQLLHTKREKA